VTLVEKIRQIMAEHLQQDPDITDKEYEALFVKYYQEYVDKGYLHTPAKVVGGKKRG